MCAGSFNSLYWVHEVERITMDYKHLTFQFPLLGSQKVNDRTGELNKLNFQFPLLGSFMLAWRWLMLRSSFNSLYWVHKVFSEEETRRLLESFNSLYWVLDTGELIEWESERLFFQFPLLGSIRFIMMFAPNVKVHYTFNSLYWVPSGTFMVIDCGIYHFQFPLLGSSSKKSIGFTPLKTFNSLYWVHH